MTLAEQIRAQLSGGGTAQPTMADQIRARLPRPAAADSGWASQRSALQTIDPRQLTDTPVNLPQTTAVDQSFDPRPKYATLNPQDNAARIGERQFSAAENLAAIPAGLAAGAIYGANEPGTSSLAGQILTPHLQAPTATPSRFVGQFAPYVAGSAALTRAIPALASQAITGATTGARLGQAAANLGRGVAVDAATSVGVEGLRQTAAGEFDPQELALQGLLYPALGVGLNVPGQVKGVRQAAENVPTNSFNLGDDPAATLRPPIDIPPVAAPTRREPPFVRPVAAPTERMDLPNEPITKPPISPEPVAPQGGVELRVQNELVKQTGVPKVTKEELSRLDAERAELIESGEIKDDVTQLAGRIKAIKDGPIKRAATDMPTPDQSPAVGKMVEKQPWAMTKAEQYAVEKGIHPKTITTLNDAMSSGDIVFQSEKLQSILHPSNKLSRGIFEARTGTKLPKTVKGTNEAIGEWQLKNNPEVLKKVREKIATQFPDKLADFDSKYPDLKPPVAKNATADVAPKVEAPTVGESAFSKVQHSEIPKSFQVEIDVPSAKTGKIRKVKANAREAYENAGKMADQHKALLACLRGK